MKTKSRENKKSWKFDWEMPEKNRLKNLLFSFFQVNEKKQSTIEEMKIMQTHSEKKMVSTPPIPIQKIPPEGPIQFESLGDGDAFIHKLLEEKHIETKEQLFQISLRPTSFDPKDELKAKIGSNGDEYNGNFCLKTSKKVHRMHFIGSYNFLNSENFEEDQNVKE